MEQASCREIVILAKLCILQLNFDTLRLLRGGVYRELLSLPPPYRSTPIATTTLRFRAAIKPDGEMKQGVAI
jgi:hypothetical protein